jgi:hypothetical protein
MKTVDKAATADLYVGDQKEDWFVYYRDVNGQ